MSQVPAAPTPRADLPPESPAPERRFVGPDRRRRPTPRFSRYALAGGRRMGGRREGEREGIFVDRYSPRLWLLLGWVALANAADSFFTLLHLQNGGIELNPVAGWMLGLGRVEFVVTKSLLITLPLLVLCMHKTFPLARMGLYVAAGTYSLLTAYHIWLL